MGEAKRVFNKKMWVLILIAVFVNICLFLYGQLGGRSISDMIFGVKQYQMLIEKYQNMELEQAVNQVNTEFNNIRKYAKSLNQDNNTQSNLNSVDNKIASKTSEELWSEADESSRAMIEYHQSLSLSQQAQLELQMKEIRTKVEYLAQYKSSIEAVIANANNMKRFEIFTKKNSFSYSNILRTASDFERVKDVNVTLDNDKATESFAHYNIMYYICAGLMVVVIYALFDERENGMWQIIHNTPNGRGILAVKRLVLIFSGAFIILFLLYVSTFVVSLLLYGGMSDLFNPVQTLCDFGKFTHVLSKGHYILRLFFLSWFTLSIFSVVLWALFTIFRNRNHTLICMAGFTGIEILLYQKIEVQSIYNAFHYINIVSFLRISDLYSTYINWGFSNYVFSVFSVVIFFLAIIGIVSAIVGVICYEKMRPQTKVSILSRIFNQFNIQYQKLFSRYPVVLKELHKLVITGKSLWAIVALIIIAVYFSSTGYMTFTDSQKEYDKMYLEHGGSDYEYIQNYVDEKVADYQQALDNLEQAGVLYENGEIDLKDYTKVANALQYQKMSLSTITEYQSKLSYAQHIKEDYSKDIWLVSDRGYEEIFGEYSVQRELILILALVTTIMIIVSECIAMEYRTGMHSMIYSAANGRRSVLIWKISACIILTVGLTAIVYGIDYFNLYKYYGMPYLSAPAISLTFLENVWAGLSAYVTIGGFIAILISVRFAIALVTMVVAMFISKLIGRKGSRALMPVALVVIVIIVCVIHSITGLV